MITIYECTDCKYCANFDWVFRVFCLHPDLPANEVCKYQPVGDESAERCEPAIFDAIIGVDYPGREYSGKQLDEAEKYSEAKYGEVTYDGIREWALLPRMDAHG